MVILGAERSGTTDFVGDLDRQRVGLGLFVESDERVQVSFLCFVARELRDAVVPGLRQAGRKQIRRSDGEGARGRGCSRRWHVELHIRMQVVVLSGRNLPQEKGKDKEDADRVDDHKRYADGEGN